MKNLKKNFTLLLIITSIISCQSTSNKSAESLCDIIKCEIYYEDDNNLFENQFFPFDFKIYNTSELLNYFSKDTKVDSLKIIDQGYISYIYDFADEKSNVRFFVKPGYIWFYINSSTIKSNILPFKNGVKIGMSKSDFNKTLKTECQCDTFSIHDDSGHINSYYFIFKDNCLEKIDIIAEV